MGGAAGHNDTRGRWSHRNGELHTGFQGKDGAAHGRSGGDQRQRSLRSRRGLARDFVALAARCAYPRAYEQEEQEGRGEPATPNR